MCTKQFYTDLVLYLQSLVLQIIIEFKDFSGLLSDFPVLFKADLIFNDFSRKPSKFKYFSSPCEPCSMTWNVEILQNGVSIVNTHISLFFFNFF